MGMQLSFKVEKNQTSTEVIKGSVNMQLATDFKYNASKNIIEYQGN